MRRKEKFKLCWQDQEIIYNEINQKNNDYWKELDFTDKFLGEIVRTINVNKINIYED